MRIGVRRRRRIAVALPQGRTMGIAGLLAGGAAVLMAWHRRRPRAASKFERWRLEGAPRV